MAKEIKIRTRIWVDNKMKRLPMQEKLVYMYLLSSPYNNGLGIYVTPEVLVAHDTKLTTQDVRQALLGLMEKDLIQYDFSEDVVFIVNFMRYNNVEESALSEILSELPETHLIKNFLETLQGVHGGNLDLDALAKDSSVIARSLAMEEDEKVPAVPATSDISSQTESKVVCAKDEEAQEQAPVASEQENEEKVEEEPKKKTRKKKEEDPSLELKFDELWKKYPNSHAYNSTKHFALKSFIKLVSQGKETVLNLERAVENYAKKVIDDEVEEKYIIRPRNFFGKAMRYQEFTDEGMAESCSSARYGLNEDEYEAVKALFNEFWKAYPKKVGKELAEQYFFEIVGKGDGWAEALIAAAKNYKEDCQMKQREEKYIYRADNFLGLAKKPYRDFLPEENEAEDSTETDYDDSVASDYDNAVSDDTNFHDDEDDVSLLDESDESDESDEGFAEDDDFDDEDSFLNEDDSLDDEDEWASSDEEDPFANEGEEVVSLNSPDETEDDEDVLNSIYGGRVDLPKKTPQIPYGGAEDEDADEDDDTDIWAGNI